MAGGEEEINKAAVGPYFELMRKSPECQSNPKYAYYLDTKAMLSFSKWREAKDLEAKHKVVKDALAMGGRVCECCLRSAKTHMETGLTVEEWHGQLFGDVGPYQPGDCVPTSPTGGKHQSYNLSASQSGHDVSYHNNLSSSAHSSLSSHTGTRSGKRGKPKERESHSASVGRCGGGYEETGLSTHVVQELMHRGFSPSQIQGIVTLQPIGDLYDADADLVEGLILSQTECDDDMPDVMFPKRRDSSTGTTSEKQLSKERQVVSELVPVLERAVCVRAGSRKENLVLKLETGMSHTEVVQSVCERLKLSRSNVDVLYRVDEGGWSEELCSILQDSAHTAPASLFPHGADGGMTAQNTVATVSYLTIRDLCDNDVINVRSFRDCVGPKCRLHALAVLFKYNATAQQKVARLASVYMGYRPVKGDGNCFYRAVMFSLLEQLVGAEDRKSIRRLHQRVLKLMTEKNMEVLNDVVIILRDVADGICWTGGSQGVAEMEEWMLKASNGLDLNLVQTCRLLVSRYLLLHQDKEMNGLKVRDAILPSYSDVSDMGSYCSKYVEAMGVDAEGPLVSGGLLFEALGCTGRTVFLDGRPEVDLTVLGLGRERRSSSTGPEIHLLLRPGHYDLLYPIPSPEPPLPAVTGPGASSARLKAAGISSSGSVEASNGLLASGITKISLAEKVESVSPTSPPPPPVPASTSSSSSPDRVTSKSEFSPLITSLSNPPTPTSSNLSCLPPNQTTTQTDKTVLEDIKNNLYNENANTLSLQSKKPKNIWGAIFGCLSASGAN
eukprot:CAMPEP_0182419612 /NCGR_PEP_ID=MMETSP1167-20130531/4026_1 /TAXON_ID=2988 /ORGANISM="Mallomonas Sp, Strain CCMP3275" /LENGTH=781 /DNA_ID=CAMNT_0024594623 /DNA_START=457 /DNA_END=2803 /DNA_ORIENTATION=-